MALCLGVIGTWSLNGSATMSVCLGVGARDRHRTANCSHFRHRDNGWRVSMVSDRVEGFCVTELRGNDIESNDRSQLGLRAKR